MNCHIGAFRCHQTSTVGTINRIGTNVERGFNVAGCIPVVGFFSGALRALLGKIQAVAGLILMGVGAIGTLCARDSHTRARYEKMMKLGKEQTLHGVLNLVRGVGESFTCGALFGCGNLLFLIPNLAQKDKFSPFLYKYGTSR